MTSMLSEVKAALRGLLKSPGFSVIAIVTLALAIGATSAVVSLVNALLVRPLPYYEPSKLVLLWQHFYAQGLDRIPVSAPEYLDYTRELKSVEIGAFHYVELNLTTGEMPERISGAFVSPSVFSVLGIQPIEGRTFMTGEFGEGNDNVIVMSERLWKQRFNSDPAIVGKPLSINGRIFTVVGIMPEAFQFPIPIFNIQGGIFGGQVDIWKPIAFSKDHLESRGLRSYSVIARLKPNVSLGQAQAELNTVVANWHHRFPDNYPPATKFGSSFYAFHDQVIGGMRTALFILSGAVAFVLLIACANLATMLLARTTARERELAIRVALGAGRWRLVQQLLTESMLLALSGAAFGVLLSLWALEFLKRIGGSTIPRLAEVNVDPTVLIVTTAIAISAGIIFGLAPALAIAKPELTEALKEGGRGATAGTRANRLRNAMIVAEIALALALLIGAGLLTKGFVRLQDVNPGFNPRNVLTTELSVPEAKYASGQPVADFYAELVRQAQTLPGVEAAALTLILPLSGTNNDSSFIIEGRDRAQGNVSPDEEIRVITPDYFKVLRVQLLAGRFFDQRDNSDAPKVVIINRAFARKWFRGKNPIGKRITQEDPAKPNVHWMTIVGVVGNVRHRGLDFAPAPEYYLPHAQLPYRGMTLAVRSDQDPRSLATAIRRQVQRLDPDLPIANVRTLDQVISDSVAPRRLSVVLLGVFAAIALVLAAVGVYGVMSYLVVQRTHEIGVRMALGAQRRDVLRLVVGHALKLIGFGALIGLTLAFASTRALSTLLYNVSAFDLTTFVVVTIALSAIALLASYIPALRATGADPMIALSHNA
jgi:putative ABC transport system permease protein